MQEYITLLKTLICTPSPSREEHKAAQVIRSFLSEREIDFKEKKNNTWAFNRFFDPARPVILLNSHIDTVKPASGWSVDPFSAIEEGERITGLGSNDAGGSLVALLALFLHYYECHDLPWNLVFSATAEEEVSGENGISAVLNELPPVTFAVVGEPTCMELAIAEKGLLVLDCTARGKAGHAAREEGENALYTALDDISKLRNYRFEKVSDFLGAIKITVTQIEAGIQHNMVPDVCRFVADVRTNEFYRNEEVYRIIAGLITSEVKPRSLRSNSSGIPANHPFALKAVQLGIPLFGSPTTSDQGIIPYPSVKIGPGDSARSHTANEFILKNEISEGIKLYIRLLEDLHL
jgi:acetylornithine deacetylase